MAGSKVSELLASSALTDTDLFYVVNGGNPRKLTVSALTSHLVNNKGVVTSINGKTATTGTVTLVKSDLGLGNVPNVNPVTTLNTLSGAVVITAGANATVQTDGNNIAVGVSPNLTLDWGKVTGDLSSNITLLAALAQLGLQEPPRQVVIDGTETQEQLEAKLLLSSTDVSVHWVNVTSTTDVVMYIPSGDVPVGSLLEIRQAGSGRVTVNTLSIPVSITQPFGTTFQTNGVGTRIQLVSLGNDAWEYR